jgi:signal peptidase I
LKKDEPRQASAEPKSGKGKLRENIEALVIAVILALFIRAFVVQAFKIPSGSMKNTLLIGDYILVNKFIYGVKVPFTNMTLIPVKDPKRGDIIVFKFPKDPSKDFIKRVIAVGGDTLEIRDKQVYVNGQLQKEVYTVHTDSHIRPSSGVYGTTRDNLAPVKVPEGKLFVMGDNRDESNDSRFWHFVDISAVKGKAFVIYWSWNRGDLDVRWKRLGSLIN